MPFIIGVAVLVALLLSKKSEAAPREAIAPPKQPNAPPATNAGDVVGNILKTGLPIAGTALAGLLGGGGAAVAGGGTAGGIAAGTTGASTGGTAASSTAGTVASAVGGGVGSLVAGCALAVVGSLAFFTSVGLLFAGAFQSIADAAQGAAMGNEYLRKGYKAAMGRAFEKLVSEMQAKIPASAWGSSQGMIRNAALLIVLRMFSKVNDLYRAGALANPVGLGASLADHRNYWAGQGVFIEDFDLFAETWIQELGAGSLASVKAGAALGAGGNAKLAEVLAKAETWGKFLFYYSALLNQPLFNIRAEDPQVGWVNRQAISQPILARWPFGSSIPFAVMGVGIGQALAGVTTAPGTGGELYRLLIDQWEMDPGRFNLVTGLYIENGLVMDFGATGQTKTLQVTSTDGINAILGGKVL